MVIHFPGKFVSVVADKLIKEGTEVLWMQKERHSDGKNDQKILEPVYTADLKG